MGQAVNGEDGIAGTGIRPAMDQARADMDGSTIGMEAVRWDSMGTRTRADPRQGADFATSPLHPPEAHARPDALSYRRSVFFAPA